METNEEKIGIKTCADVEIYKTMQARIRGKNRYYDEEDDYFESWYERARGE